MSFLLIRVSGHNCVCPHIAALLLMIPVVAMASETHQRLDSSGKYHLGGVEIQLLDVYMWRDWMPEVEKPGRDGGSPLHIRVRLQIYNSADQDALVRFDGAIFDNKIPHSVTLLARLKKESDFWDGHLEAGQTATVEFATDNGPYIEPGSWVEIMITFRDLQGNTVSVLSPKTEIRRTF